MFILLLTFLCFVVVPEEYMLLFITCPNLICHLLFMSMDMEWEKVLVLVLVSFCHLFNVNLGKQLYQSM
jgi:hypothetical protein